MDFVVLWSFGQNSIVIQEKEADKKMSQKQREKMRPKVGKLDIDYQVLHDAFFKHQTKPNLSYMGDLYYEGKEFEAQVRLAVLTSFVTCDATTYEVAIIVRSSMHRGSKAFVISLHLW